MNRENNRKKKRKLNYKLPEMRKKEKAAKAMRNRNKNEGVLTKY